jgi:hypothetical protein
MGISYYLVGRTTGEIIRIQHRSEYRDPIPELEAFPTSSVYSELHHAQFLLPKYLWLKIYARFKDANPDGTDIRHENFNSDHYWPAYAKHKGWDVNDEELHALRYSAHDFDSLADSYAPELKDPEFLQELLKTARPIQRDEPLEQEEESLSVLGKWMRNLKNAFKT